jgi:predicted AAA+ superfamily ATPase
MDAMTAYQLQQGLILTEDESERLTIEGKIIHIIPVWLLLLQ